MNVKELIMSQPPEAHRKLCREVLTNNLRTYQALKRYIVSETETLWR